MSNNLHVLMMIAATVTPMAHAAEQALTSEQSAAVARAERELREHTKGAGTTRYSLLSVEPQQWSDSGLGCRKPGAIYRQVITSGYVVKFRSELRTYEVHVAREHAVVCDGFREWPVRVRATQLPQLEALAREDLAAKLEAKPEDIRVLRRVPTQWRIAELECRDLTEAGTARVAGYKLYLRYRRRVYTYHTDDAHVFACPAIAGQ
jgi:hypothetical protein